MESVPYIAKPILNARDAIASHVRWKITLLTAARMREPLSERATHSIQQPAECAIRRWLLSDETVSLRDQREYAIALEKHLEFHRTMQTIAGMLNSGQYLQAELRLSDQTGQFERTSMELANALMALDRVQRRRLAS